MEAERIALSEQVGALEPVQWDAHSRCEGWRVRDVLGHLVHMAESTGRSMAADLRARPGGRDDAFAAWGREIGQAPVPELAERLRRSAGSRYNGMPAVALSEVLVHGDDMLQPLGRRAE